MDHGPHLNPSAAVGPPHPASVSVYKGPDQLAPLLQLPGSNHGPHDQQPSLTYYQVHMYLTIPVLALLYMVVRPILHPRLDPIKLGFLSVLAFVYTSPWDNWIISRGAWSYCPTCTLGITFGSWVPLEEYAFFVIQTLTSGLIALAVLNTGHTPAEVLAGVMLERDKTSLHRVQRRVLGLVSIALLWIPSLGCLAGWPRLETTAHFSRQRFYLAAILAWALPVLAFQWSVAAEYMVASRHRALVAVALSTTYLCLLDCFALNAGAWTIERGLTLGVDVLPGLPLEEAVFFLITNCMLVGGLLTCDQTFARLHLDSKLHTSHSLPFISQAKLWASHTLFPPSLDPTVLSDTLVSSRLIRHGSRSFHLASKLFPWDLRSDIHALYAFCRVTDDATDDPKTPIKVKRQALEVIQAWVGAGMDVQTAQVVADQVHTGSRKAIGLSTVSAMRAMTRVKHKYSMSVQPLLDLIRGYMWDLNGTQVESVEDMIQYSELVAGTVGEASTEMMIQWDRFGRNAKDNAKTGVDPTTIRRAVDLGVSLQLINIARDLRTDANMGRCYVPRAFWPATATSFPVDNDVALHAIAAQLVGLANTFMVKALAEGLPKLPEHFRPAVFLAAQVYGAIGDELVKAGDRGHGYPKRMVVGRRRKAWEAVRALYGSRQPL